MITTNSSSIRVKLSSAITTSQMAITGHYVTMSVRGVVSNVVQINMLTNGVTAVVVVPSSSDGGVVNVLKNLQIANVDTVANQVIIEQWDGIKAKSMCPAISLDVTKSIQINSDGDLTVIPAATGGGTGSGTVTSVSGTGTVSGITLTGTVTTAGNLTLGGTLAVTPSNFASQTANTFLAAPNGVAGVPTFRTIVAADVPTLNQNTTGNAATVTTNANLTGDVTSVGNATTYAGTVPVSKGGTGVTACTVVGQFVSTETGTMATGTGTIPLDNTIPQITEGTEYMTLAITPKSATSKLKIEVIFNGTNSVATNNIIVALFQDAAANALSSSFVTAPGAGYGCQVKFTHIMTSGTTSATTFRVRAGGNAASTTTFNGSGGAAFFGGTIASSISITEFLP